MCGGGGGGVKYNLDSLHFFITIVLLKYYHIEAINNEDVKSTFEHSIIFISFH